MNNVEPSIATALANKRARQSPAKPAARKPRQKRKRRERVAVPGDKRWLTWEEAESHSCLSRNTLRGFLDQLGAKRIGARLIIDRVELDRWLASQPSAA